jgi:hypothetical protein
MHAPQLAGELPRRRLRHFAWFIALVLALVAWQQTSFSWAWGFRLAAAVIFAIGTVLPNAFRRPYRVLLFILNRLGLFLHAAKSNRRRRPSGMPR